MTSLSCIPRQAFLLGGSGWSDARDDANGVSGLVAAVVWLVAF